MNRRAKLTNGPEHDEERVEKWWKDLAVAGNLIGQRWQKMIPQIDRLASEQKGITTILDQFQDCADQSRPPRTSARRERRRPSRDLRLNRQPGSGKSRSMTCC